MSLKSDLREQVLDYQRSGAFVDLAILQLRRALAGSAHHHAEANKVSQLLGSAGTVRTALCGNLGGRL